MYNKINRIHFVGVGGIGMSAIAELVRRGGYTVTGSDVQKNDSIRNLESHGITVYQGHRKENTDQADVVVYSSAISKNNPEILAALEKNIPIIPRAEMLAELMRMKYGIAIAGAHGKTTTTSMIATVLTDGDLDPTVVVGGRMDNFGGTNARLGNGDFMVVEADESDGSFNKLTPSIAVVTNLDREHMDYYKTMSNIKKSFLSFMNKVPFYGLAVACGDDTSLRLLLPKVARRKKTYGFSKDNHYKIESYQSGINETICKINTEGKIDTLRLQVPGKHNALNAVAALIVSDELGVPREKSLMSLRSFIGVQRRFQKRGELKGVQFIDDYAHHPTEIKATLKAAKERFPKSKIRVLFQPHRYSRVEDLLEDFSHSFKLCDSLLLTDIYAAGEKPLDGIDSELLAESVRQSGQENVNHVKTPMEGIEQFLSESMPGDLILTLGAGDLPNVYKQLF